MKFPTTKLKIALAQLTPQDGEMETNIVKVIHAIKNAASRGADVVVFPEKFLTGYALVLMEENPNVYAVSQGDERLSRIGQCCQENKIHAIVGSPFKKGEHFYISSLVFGPTGEIEAIYDKNYLFHTESSLFKAGSALSMIEMKGWKLGLGICYDARFPQHAQRLANRGCHVYLVCALFSQGVGDAELKSWFPARAKDNGIYAIVCNFTGTTGGF